MRRWYAVQTLPRKERLAEWHLNNQDFATFCPVRRRLRGTGGRARTVFDPFFPSYIFVELDIERQRWRCVNGTVGVARLVCFGSSPGALPTALPRGLVEHLRKASTGEGEIRFDERLAEGDRVRVTGGPFDGLCGILESSGANQRVNILLEILARQTRVEIDRGRLMAA